MSELKSLPSRIDAEFAAVEKQAKDLQIERLQQYRERRLRLRQLDQVFQKLAEAWKPRLDTLLQKFGDRVQVTPRLTPSSREAAFEFQSNQGRIRLRFAALTDPDVSKVILAYDLEIIPVFFRYEPHAELQFPLDAVDEEAAGRWVDDRIIDFLRGYLSMGENEFDMQEHMVEDPVAHVRFPDFAAGATLEWQGKKYYFIGEETRQEFARQLGPAGGLVDGVVSPLRRDQ
jgi:YHS domain-containing protein